MHRDESELKTARKETEHEQNVTAMTERFRKCLPCRLRRFGHRCLPDGCAGRCESERQRQNQEGNTPENQKRFLPAEFVHHGDRDRGIEELPKRPGGSARAERKRAPFFRQQFAERTQHDIE
jgi:hypothetical protein